MNLNSGRNSSLSQAASTSYMLADMHSNNNSGPLTPPNAPFAGGAGGSLSSRPESFPNSTSGSISNLSLSVNYAPSKFSGALLAPGGPRRRKGGKGAAGLDGMVPKAGGGIEAFRTGEARLPGQADEDYDGVSGGWFGGGGKRKAGRKLRWNKFKWALFITNTIFSVYSLTALIFCLLTWFDVWQHADIVRVGNRPELIFSTFAASLGIFTSLIGYAGILLNNRSFLAVYTFLCWITFAFLVVPGYLTYKRRTFNLEGKINAEWSRSLGAEGRLRIQNKLECCGYFSPFIEATISQTCYARSVLPGCKLRYLDFERLVLRRWYTVDFALVPLHIAVILSGLLCSNHVTYRFGKGMTPKAYRLSMSSMAVIMDNYATQLAEQYGQDIASSFVARSKTDSLGYTSGKDFVSGMTNMPYAEREAAAGGTHQKYDSLGSRAPDTPT